MTERPSLPCRESTKSAVWNVQAQNTGTCSQYLLTKHTGRGGGTSGAMRKDLAEQILAVVERVPDWVRRDLSSRDEIARQRAQETLAGLIANAVNEDAEP